MAQFERGLKLYSIARENAKKRGIKTGTLGMADLIWQIQEREGNTPCFRRRKECPEIACCWQASCGAEMRSK